MGCTGQPISWLRLEQHALAHDAAVEAHLAECAACRSCMDEIRGDVVALPALPELAPRRRRWTWTWTWSLPALAAAALLLLIVWPRAHREDRVAIKGVGEVVIDLVREHDGAITESARTFEPGDRWKVVVTCPPSAGAWLDVAVFEIGGAAAPDYPMPAAHVACGNRVYLPGAFVLTGARPNRVCVRVSADGPPARDGAGDMACVTVAPR